MASTTKRRFTDEFKREPAGAPRRHAWRKVELPPMVSSLFVECSLILEMLVRCRFAPIEFGRGASLAKHQVTPFG